MGSYSELYWSLVAFLLCAHTGFLGLWDDQKKDVSRCSFNWNRVQGSRSGGLAM